MHVCAWKRLRRHLPPKWPPQGHRARQDTSCTSLYLWEGHSGWAVTALTLSYAGRAKIGQHFSVLHLQRPSSVRLQDRNRTKFHMHLNPVPIGQNPKCSTCLLLPLSRQLLFLLTLSFETHPTRLYNPFHFHITSLSWIPSPLKNLPPGSTFLCFLDELDVYPQS